MKRKQTLSLADDRRARVPFALISVVLLTTSVVTVSIVNQRSTPEVDVSPEQVHERTTLAAESVITEAASDAISAAGQQPVTSVDGSSSDLDTIYELERNPDSDDSSLVNPFPEQVINREEYPVRGALAHDNPSANEVFKRYVKLRIYLKVDKRLREGTQDITGPNGEARGEAFLPPIEREYESVKQALDRIELEIGGDGSELDRGEYRVSVKEVQHTVSVGDNEIHREQQSYSTTDETAVFEMHSQVNDYQRMLDEDIEKLLYATLYPTLSAQANIETFLGEPYEAFAWQELITNQELISYTNLLNYDMQQAAFGTRDQSYPTGANIARGCLLYYYMGNLLAPLAVTGIFAPLHPPGRALANVLFKAGLKKIFDKLLIKATPISHPYNGLCYYTTYAAIKQSTTTATTDIPRVSQFADEETEWESNDTLYEEFNGSDEFELSPSQFQKTLSENGGDEAEAVADKVGEGPNSKEEIRIGPFANRTYNTMFGLDSNRDGPETTFDTDETDDIEEIEQEAGTDVEVNDTEGDFTDEIEDRSDIDTGIGKIGDSSDEDDGSNEDDSVNATETEREDVNRLRKRLIEDIDPINVSGTQLTSSDDVFGTMIYQIEQNADTYIYGDGYQTDAYGLRNGYLQRVIDSLEETEERRRKSAEQFNNTVGNESVDELLVLGQASIEGNESNPDRIEEIADNGTYDSKGPGTDRFDPDNIERDPLVWWEKESGSYNFSRWNAAPKEPAGVPRKVELDSSGIPEEVTTKMLYKFGDGELPVSEDVTSSVRIAISENPTEGGSDGLAPPELDEENRTDEAYLWNIRAVDKDKDLYRVTNGQLIGRPFGGSQPVFRVIDGVPKPVDSRTYLQLHKVDLSMNLTDAARDEVGVTECQAVVRDCSDFEPEVKKDRYVLTAVDVSQETDTQEGIKVEKEELAVPEIQSADNEDFQFDIHASPGYLSGLPIVREIEPGVRPPGKGPLHGRNSPYAPFASKVTNPLPNPGIPLIPLFPPDFELWLLSANGWGTQLKAEYARFELRSKTSNGLDTGPETYVRQDMSVELDIDGRSIPVGSVEPISFSATNAFPLLVPGFSPSIKAPPAGSSSWGTGNNINIISANIPKPIVTGIAWTPEKCTSAWPEVGPGVSPISIDRNCADFGPVGEALTSKGPSAFVTGSVLVHASVTNDPQTEEAEQQLEQLCELDEPCPDIGPRDRNSNT